MQAVGTRAGFVLPVVLGIILLAGLFAVQATMESGSATLLATQRQLHQNAFEAAESGVIAAINQLGSGIEPATVQTSSSTAAPSGSSTVQTTMVARLTLPSGFSADRVVETQYEIRSTGHSVRGSEATVVQGVRQMRVATPP
jgi:Tfp pilus assembly protein PilX